MATNKEILLNALNNIKANKNSAVSARANEILNKEVNPQIEENNKKFNDAWQAARVELDKKNQSLKDEASARALSEIEKEYNMYTEVIEKFLEGEEK